MKTMIVLIKLYAIGVLLQATICIGIIINANAAPFELCPKMQFYEKRLGSHAVKTSPIWPYFMGNVIMKHYMSEIRYNKSWK